jgi:sn-glycerol 3-phosphate transport system permease protein
MNSRNWIYAWLMLLPAFVFLIAFTHLPAVTTLFDSFFTTAKGRRPAVFTGLGNYQKMLEDPIFVKAMVNSAIYAAITIPASIALSLAMALMVHRAFRGVSLMRMAFFTPTVLPLIAVANIWLFFYAPGFGLIDQIRLFFGLPSANYVGQPDTALYAVAAVTVWKEAGFFMIFFLAALQTIPQSLREAAAIEGCSRWTFFRRVTSAADHADDAVRLGQRGDQRLPAGRPCLRHDQGRAGQRDHAASLLHLRDRVPVLGHGLCGALTVVLIAILSVVGIGQFFLADRRVHYK